MAWKRILYEKNGNIVKTTMNWPEKRNAQDFLMLEEMMEAFKKADADDDVRVIILAGAGGCFSAGHDMSGKGLPSKAMKDLISPVNLAAEGAEAVMALEDYIFHDQALAMRNVSKPTIAQVEGYCIAGALYSACMMDLIVASEDAVFQNPTMRMNVMSMEFLCEPWEFGPRKAKEFLWTGAPMSAQEAWRLGMVNRVVPREQLEEEVMKLAKQIAQIPPFMTKLTKRSINHTLDLIGQSASWEHFYLVHQLGHNTKVMKQSFEQLEGKRQKDGSVKDFLEARDEPFQK